MSKPKSETMHTPRFHRDTFSLALALAAIALGSCEFTRTAGYDDAIGLVPERADESAAPAVSAVPKTGPLSIGIKDAILHALENNHGLSVQRFGPAKYAAFKEQAASAFDPRLTTSFSGSREDNYQGAGERMDSTSGAMGVSSMLPTGTHLSIDVTPGWIDSTLTGEQHTARVGLGVTQPLLRGVGRAANLASVRQAALDIRGSEYELRGFAESLVAQVETAYWNCALAERQIEIVSESLRLAEEQLRNTEERVNVGKLAGIELAAARAEVASRREALISARGALATSRIRLLRLVNPPGNGLWERKVVLRDVPAPPEGEFDAVRTHVETALRQRPDLNQARLGIERGELEVVKTKNGLLPKLDLFLNLGRTGYADSFGGTFEDLGGEGYDISAGISFEWALGNRDARAKHRWAVLSRNGAALALENMEQLVQVNVRTSYVTATTAREEIAATAATRAFKEEALRAENEKFRVGKSTTFQVAQAQRDLVASRISEVQAVVGYLKALVDLYRVDGSLLARRGISAPGASCPK